MSVYREKKFHLFVLLALAALLVVWKPWSGFVPEARGLPLSVEIGGGSGILLELQSSIVEFESTENDLEGTWSSVEALLSPLWDLNLLSIEENLIRFEVGGRVTEAHLERHIGVFGEVVGLENEGFEIVDLAVEALRSRIDEHGLGGTRVRKARNSYILIETTADPETLRTLLTKLGRVEFFAGDERAITPNEILGLGRPSITGGLWVLPAYFTEDGERRFNSAVAGKAGDSLTIYVDRPFDAVLIFTPDLPKELRTIAYDADVRVFKENLEAWQIEVTAFPSEPDRLSENARRYLEAHAGEKLRVILLGSEENFSEEFLEAIPDPYTYETIERLPEELADEWIMRACGFISSIPIPEDIAENGITPGTGINIPMLGGAEEARTYRTLVLHRIPTRIHGLEITAISPRVKLGFASNALLVSLLGLLGAVLLALKKHRRQEIGLAMLVFGFASLVILLGIFTAFGIAVTLAGALMIVGIFFVCVMHLIFVTYRMLAGITPHERVEIGWRIPKALAPVYLGSFLSILLLIFLSGAGVRPLWGPSVVMVTGLILGALLIFPIFARVLGLLVLRKREQ